ncbi:MAG: L,D-transpeptidase family protein [Gammaproteobacteria bacterium]|nr:L,D-transpeptidase family protein [Gammaproteobacteria bacterium]MDH5303958.1 L,D-transpeptidase family protein [Gammaproteobacteria bacterium]MDH5321115.1 L,D-transpeptidase family protein [Gammaproteobacteria bacterium]
MSNKKVIALLLSLSFTTGYAEIFELPPAGFDVIGAIATVTARDEDTLVEIARRHGLGYEDIVRANPGVNIWVPGEGTQIVLPTRYVLPPGPRSGLVLNVAEYRLYYYPMPKEGEPAYVMTYPVSIGRQDWETPLGMTEIIAKAVNPSWYPPQSVRDEHLADGDPLPPVVPPGPDNPLGKHAMRLGMPGYLIHGTNKPAGVGMRVSHGCVRMFPEDIEFLFDRVATRTKVRIINAPIKFGWDGDELVIEAHPVLAATEPEMEHVMAAHEVPAVRDQLTTVTELFIAATYERSGELDWSRAEEVIDRADGIPVAVGLGIKNAATSAALE